MKYKIEKNTVQETLIIPLYCAEAVLRTVSESLPRRNSGSLIDEIDYDFSRRRKKSRSLMQRFGSLEVAMRQNDLAFEVQALPEIAPLCGGGQSRLRAGQYRQSCDNGSCKIYNLDFPDVIAVRQRASDRRGA